MSNVSVIRPLRATPPPVALARNSAPPLALAPTSGQAAESAPASEPVNSHVKVWTVNKRNRTVPVDLKTINEGGDLIAQTAYKNAGKVDDFLRTRFGRNGWDNKGAPLEVVVHAPAEDGQPMNNAFWDLKKHKIILGDGDGRIFAPLGGALDVLTHETVHAVVDSEVNLPYKGQQGGINESWADVIGSLADPDHDWLVGEDVFTPATQGDAIRDLASPRYSNLKQITPGTDVEMHDLSGIPSLAAVRVADKIGRDQMGEIWYRALCEHLDSRAGFSGAARATLQSAIDLFGVTSPQYTAVTDAWKSVGVNARFAPGQRARK
ncbi:MAG: M4 family metallopeptidase [Thermoleophilia bacterium]|nr:M4 family metallopeptidase [Thermoleophilia bacterium]